MPEVTGATVKKDIEKAEAVESTESVKPSTLKEPENGVSSTSPEKKSPEKNEGEILLAQGRRHLYVKDYPNAVATLGDACAKLSEMYGDLADNCADAYFCYGRALLELAREESNVLGTEPEKEDSSEEGDEDGDEEDKEEQNEDGEAEAKPQATDKKNQAESTEENENNANEEKESTADETIDTTKVDESVDGSGKEEDVDNLQLAWEVLELAKKIYERQASHAKLAETYLYLGEIGLESENYNGAIDDMKRCVEIQKQILAPDNRDIAETYFQLGVACSLCNEFDEAISHFKTSKEILETRIKNLEKNGPSETDTDKNPFYSVEAEVTEIKALLPEISAKIVDMEDFKQETIKSVMASLKDQPPSKDGAGPSSATTSSSTPITNGTTSKPASDISHLVRKKRKPEDEVSSDQSLKKTCPDETHK